MLAERVGSVVEVTNEPAAGSSAPARPDGLRPRVRRPVALSALFPSASPSLDVGVAGITLAELEAALAT